MMDKLIKESIKLYRSTNFKTIKDKEFILNSNSIINNLNNLNLNDIKEYITQNNLKDLQLFHENYFNIFLLPLEKNKIYDLHNHPEMFVITKLIYGKLNIKSCDIKEKVSNDIYDIKNYKNYNLTSDNNLSIVSPLENNLHEFLPLEDTLILDIIFNDYDYIERKYSEFKFLNQNQIKFTNYID